MADETPTPAASEPETPAAAEASTTLGVPVKVVADDTLGDGGKAALEAERRARREAEKAYKAAQADLAELEKYRQAAMTEQERAIAAARDEARAEMAKTFAAERVKDKVELAASGKLADPGDAIHLIGDLSEFVTPAGDVDTKAIASAIDALVKAKPYLAPQTAKAAPLPGGGAKPSNGFSMDDFIRHSARGRP